jgi:hypothetical protein
VIVRDRRADVCDYLLAGLEHGDILANGFNNSGTVGAWNDVRFDLARDAPLWRSAPDVMMMMSANTHLHDDQVPVI